ncbi:hypothetical protein CPC08DRAFT_765599 [Agrocybe pediades]|nr:hypothetical protein CPC08DRAFT_765599 [Agrocybe pediades]
MSHHVPCHSSTPDPTSLTYNDEEPATPALDLPPAQGFLQPTQEEDQHGLSYYLALARAAAERCMKKCSRRNDEELYEDSEFNLIEEMALQLPEDRESIEQSVHGRTLGFGVSDDDADLDATSGVRIEEGAASTAYSLDDYANLVGLLLVPPSLHHLCSKPRSHS